MPRARIELATQGFSFFLRYRKDWTISSPRLSRGLGAFERIIVGTHLLVSTPFPELLPFGTWLGIVPTLSGFPRIHPVFNTKITLRWTENQSSALPLSYLGIKKSEHTKLYVRTSFVDQRGFEPPTPSVQTRCSTK